MTDINAIPGRDPLMELRMDLGPLLNRHSAENGSNTPDFVLANFLLDCLRAFDLATHQREHFYGLRMRPGQDLEARRTIAGYSEDLFARNNDVDRIARQRDELQAKLDTAVGGSAWFATMREEVERKFHEERIAGQWVEKAHADTIEGALREEEEANKLLKRGLAELSGRILDQEGVESFSIADLRELGILILPEGGAS